MLKSHAIKKLPSGVKEAWFYTGKHASVHIVLFSEVRNIKIAEGVILHITTPSKQIKLSLNNFRSLHRKVG
jgi:hypothetical protein